MSVASARRSRARRKAAKAANPEVVFIKEIRVGRLSTLSDWKREISRLYRHMRLGKIDPTFASKLAWVAKIAAQLTQMEQELRELQSLRERLQQLQGTTAIEFNGAGTTDYLPAAKAIVDDDEDAHEDASP